jgi:Spy/CpxP family protein refolding chaperone
MKNIILLVVLILVGCTTPVETTSPVEDYSLVMFGESGAALSGMMKPQSETQPTDGSTAFRLPPALQLTQEQFEAIKALKNAFRTEHATQLQALHEIFQQAREARESGATREQVRTILEQSRNIAQSLREPVMQLHLAILEILSPEQKAWLIAHRPSMPVRGRP